MILFQMAIYKQIIIIIFYHPYNVWDRFITEGHFIIAYNFFSSVKRIFWNVVIYVIVKIKTYYKVLQPVYTLEK